jgi:DNA-binding transcriptional LysR family regulator
MIDMSDVHVRRLDGTLLLVFVETLQCRKLSLVAERLGLTASAVSHAVARLRDIFDDPLFLRRPGGVVPTERALALAPFMSGALERFRSAFGEGERFDPSAQQRVFRIAALDYAVGLVANAAVERALREAPGVRLSFVSLGRDEALVELLARRIDCAIGVFDDIPDGVAHRLVARETFVTVARRGHPAIAGALDLDTYLSLDHLIVSAAGDMRGTVDAVLARRGLTRRVVAGMPQFLATLATVANTDMIATVPDGLARDHARRFGLAVHPCPLDVPGFDIVAVAGAGGAPDRGVAWLLDTLGADCALAGGSASLPAG